MKTYKVTAITKGWKEQWEDGTLNKALKSLGGSGFFTDVDSRCSDSLMVVASPKLTPKQAQELFDDCNFFLCAQVFEGTLKEIKVEANQFRKEEDDEEDDLEN